MLIVCTGTGTEVGKTWVGCTVLSRLAPRAAARKPAQSFAPSELGSTDAELLAAACGCAPTEVTPEHRWYPVPMAPPMAAASLGRPGFTLDDLITETVWPTSATIRWLETAGGPRSPLADDGDTVDLCQRLQPDLVVLVADAGLGTINAVRLAAAALAHPTALVLNRYDDSSELHRRNRAFLDSYDPIVDVEAWACSI